MPWPKGVPRPKGPGYHYGVPKGTPPWNKGLPKIPGSGMKPHPEELELEVVRLYLEEKLSAQEIGRRLLWHRAYPGRAVTRILRRRGVRFRSLSEATSLAQRGRRRGPRYSHLFPMEGAGPCAPLAG